MPFISATSIKKQQQQKYIACCYLNVKVFYCTYSLLNQTPAGRIFKPFPHAHTFCFLLSSDCLCPQTIPVWPLLPVLLSAVRVEEPCSDALQRPTFQMWILRPGLRWRHDAQQPHPHTHRREAVQVSNSEYPQTPIKSTHLTCHLLRKTTQLIPLDLLLTVTTKIIVEASLTFRYIGWLCPK